MSSGDAWLLVTAAGLVVAAGLFSAADAALTSFSRARAVELAAGEVQRFHDDLDAARREREGGIDACRAAVAIAAASLEEARAMQGRVAVAEQSARTGLGLLVEKLSDS